MHELLTLYIVEKFIDAFMPAIKEHRVLAWILRIVSVSMTSMAIVTVSILFPEFHKMMALLGSFFSFTVSILFPEICYLKLYGSNLTKRDWAHELIIIFIGSFCGLIGTIWACIPE